MAGRNGAILAVKIISDASKAARGFQDAERMSDRFARGLDRASVAAAGTLAAIGAMAKKSFDAASELQQQSGAVEAVFGANAAAADKLARSAADRVGLSTAAYSQFASLVGSQLKNTGVSADQLAPKTERLIALGADLAAQYGGSTADAVSAISSLLRGERDPIERYAVSINQAAIDAALAAGGMDKLTGAAKREAEAQAALTLLTQQTSSAHGAFAREANTAAGQQQRATAAWENAKAALGESLLPAVSAVAAKVAELATKLADNPGPALALVTVLGSLAATVLAVNAAVKVYTAASAAYKAVSVGVTAAQWAWNAALAANPMILLGLAVAAVVVAIVLLYQNVQWFRDLCNNIGAVIVFPFVRLFGIVGDLVSGIRNAGSAFDVMKAIAVAAISVITLPLRTLWNLLMKVGAGIARIPGVSGLVSGFMAPAPGAGGGDGPSAPRGAAGAPPGAAPALFGASVSGGGSTAGQIAGDAPVGRGDTYHITISGLLDSDQAARKIEQLLNSRNRRVGTATAGAFR